ncbi:hypothetical protein ACFL6D_01095 [Spirochaetota bacterium]
MKYRIFDVEYEYITLEDGGDLYITDHGQLFRDLLMPENFLTDSEWFDTNAVRLSGSSCIYKIPTKKVNGHQKDFVLRWNRMGQDIPGTEDFNELAYAEFNSPFEEFSLLMELRRSNYESEGRMLTQRPLAIYVPAKKVEIERTGRKEYLMQHKIESHGDIELHIDRQYAVIYEWIKGIDAAEACKWRLLEEKNIELLTLKADSDLRKKGFVIKDRKPHHIIIRPLDFNDFVRDEKGEILYAVIDYEMLERTPERDSIVKKSKRISYLKKQKDRFNVAKSSIIPDHLKMVNIMGVDYIFGRAAATGGLLWVVGKDPDLFDYFLPEKWEATQRTKLSAMHEVYHTMTKDHINLVWKVSKAGIMPNMDPFKKDEKKILDYGYNSPFEEVSIAIELSRKGIRTVYPRAIYMANKKTDIAKPLEDMRRYRTHETVRTPEGMPVLREGYTYVIIWGYWNGPDEKLAHMDADHYEAVDVLRAYREKIISEDEYRELIKNKKKRLSRAGIEDLNLRGSHVLLSLNAEGKLVLDNNKLPDERVCNFELLRRKV